MVRGQIKGIESAGDKSASTLHESLPAVCECVIKNTHVLLFPRPLKVNGEIGHSMISQISHSPAVVSGPV